MNPPKNNIDSKYKTWEDIEYKILRRTGKWITGIIVQRRQDNKIRIKLFKGMIKDNGSRKISYKNKIIRFSMIQRFNITSKDFWNTISEKITAIVERYLSEKEETRQVNLQSTLVEY